MKPEYQLWLSKQGFRATSINSRISEANRVEEHYGSLDDLYERDRCRLLLEILKYSADDQRSGKPNPSTIAIDGDLRTSLASYKSAVALYCRFRQLSTAEQGPPPRLCEAVVQPRSQSAASSLAPRRATTRPTIAPRLGPRTLVDFDLNGQAALQAVIASSQYGTTMQAVASLLLFSHPDTVRQTGGKALFPAVRDPRRVGEIGEVGGRRVLLDDNKAATDAFLWANGLNGRGLDVQFNHVYGVSRDLDAYTALPNLCMSPAFVAKLTDTSKDVRRMIQFRSYQLYGWTPAGHAPPERPEGYEVLEWAAPLPPVPDLHAVMAAAMATKPKSRTVMAARTLGWLFGEPTGL